MVTSQSHTTPKGGVVVGAWAKKAAWLLVAGFVVFYLFTRPEDAAHAVKTFFGAFNSIVRFFTELAKP